MTSNGLLMVIADPNPSIEEEFNAWFDTEHLPERSSLPGFYPGNRFVSCDRAGRYLVLYDLEDVSALHSDHYKAAIANLTPWTKRILPRQPTIRHEATQLVPGTARQVSAARHLLLRFNGVPADALGQLTEWTEGIDRRGVSQRRLFRITDSAPGSYLVIISGAGDLVGDLNFATLGSLADRLTLMELFAPYRTLG